MNRLLIIEPDFILGRTYRDYFGTAGYQVDICGSIQEAVNQLDRELPDLIVLELQLSSHNGFEFLYEMRTYPEWNHIPVLVHTMVPLHVSKVDNLVKQQLGIVDYLYKPTTSLSKLHFSVQKNLYMTPA